MSNLSDLIDEISKENSGGIQITGAIFGVLADFSGALGFVQLGVNIIESFLSSDNQLQQALAVIQQDFEKLANLIAPEDKLARMRDIDAGINPALGVYQQLPAILERLPSLSQEFILSQIQTCLAAALFFAENDDKWQAVWSSIPYYSDAWSGSLAPDKPDDGLVFNHTYTLPQYLRAISILLTTIGALAPKTLPDYKSALSICLNRLSTVHDTIVSTGLVGTRVPAIDDVGSVVGSDSSSITYWQSNWSVNDPFEWPYGAVEKYSAASSVASYITKFYEIDTSSFSQSDADHFIGLVRLRIEQQKKALYIQLGLTSVRQTINYLRSLLGQPPLAGPHYEDWTMREALGFMNVPVPGSVRSMLSVIKATPPFGAGWAFAPDPNDPTVFETQVQGRPLPAGLRGLLTG